MAPSLRWTLSLAVLSLFGCAGVRTVCAETASAAAPSKEAARLEALFAREWEWHLREYPATATSVGDARYNDRLPDLSLAAIAARKEHTRAVQRELAGFHLEELPPPAKLNYELFKRDTDEEVEGFRFPAELLAVDQFNGPQQSLTDIAEDHPRLTAKDLRDYLKRLDQVPRYIEQTEQLMRRGLEAGVVPPRQVLDRVGPVIRKHVVADPTRAPLYALVFTQLPPSIPAADADALRSEAQQLIRTRVTPAFERFSRFFEKDYLPHGRTAIGWSALPDGPAWYAYLARVHTTTSVDVAEIHRVGLAEVERIRGEMEQVKTKMAFRGSLADLFRHLRTDDRFFFKDSASLLASYRDLCKRVDPQLVKLFSKLPRLPYGVSAVPEHSAPGLPGAYYSRGSLEAGRPGVFYANTYNLRARPKWQMESLMLHEAVPGHHFQIALAQEQTDLPNFRRYGLYGAFVEGWGLYSESLGDALGLYQDSEARIGRLNNEIWRAIRLVVDTGIHAQGWSREKAIDYFAENAGSAREEIEVEVDRYIAWAGQALSYKMGELKLQALRKKAESALGPRFDLRAFHDFILAEGGLPLGILETRVDAWIAEKRGG